MSDGKKEEAWYTQERRCRYSLLQLCGTANKRAGKSLKRSQIREIISVHGTHASRRKSKKTGKMTVSTNVEFTYPARDGRKSASIKKCTIVQSNYNTGWRRIAI